MQIKSKIAGNFEKLYPVTLGNNVKLNNGMNLEEWKKQIDDLYNKIEDDYVSLWKGAYTMTGVESITLSKNLRECKHGWILVFKDANYDDNYSYHHVPKIVLNRTSTLKFIVGASGGAVTSKLIVLTDTKLTGHNANASNGNEKSVLVEVYSY